MTERPIKHAAHQQLKGLGLLAEALTYPDTGETIELLTADDGGKWFWLHEVAKATDLPHLRKELSRRLDLDEWQKVDVSAGQDSVASSDVIRNPMRVLISLPGVIKLLSTARKPSARAFDRWARHEVLAPLLARGTEPQQHGPARGYVDSLLALAFETQARVLGVQRQQAETLAKLTEILDRVTTESLPGVLPRQRHPEAAELLDKWRQQHLLSEEVWTVAAYALPIIVEHGTLQASPSKVAERTGLNVAVVNRALLDLCLAGCLRPVGETARAKHTIYQLGRP
ncbi:Bro-N domain-containing protein [Streptomyces sp. JJ66]|uniref:BRO family protein n=1 Tax=Streptomyces sp. JJ66 TaxID=2803843 RepID=UPI001C55EECC|nr:Bro-N domain-containing protein [Streptomyces sp. JJ66]MBW1601707.1 Bro-N domain-containing protein [Streptomyces sp. JJ66]